jgi:hypothetical protein
MDALVNQRMDHGCTKESEEGSGCSEAPQASQGGCCEGSAEAPSSSQVSDA